MKKKMFDKISFLIDRSCLKYFFLNTFLARGKFYCLLICSVGPDLDSKLQKFSAL